MGTGMSGFDSSRHSKQWPRCRAVGVDQGQPQCRRLRGVPPGIPKRAIRDGGEGTRRQVPPAVAAEGAGATAESAGPANRGVGYMVYSALKERELDDRDGDRAAEGKGRRDDHGDRAVAGEDCPPRGRRPFGTPEVEAMSQAVSPSVDRVYGLARAARCWNVSRGTVYRHRQAPIVPKRRPGPVGPCDDATLLEHIRKAIAESRFTGEGYRRSGPVCAFPASAARPDECAG